MSKAVKKPLSVMFAVIWFILLFSVFASAAGMSADEIAAKAGDTLKIPICITDNSGIMGFKICVEYPDVFANPSVSRGDITASGNFNDSLTVSDNGAFEVLWNSTADVKGDGVLFNLNLKIKDDAPDGEYEIKLICSQPDTFNEKWQDVELGVQSVKVTVGEPEQTVGGITRVFFEIINNLFDILLNIIRNLGVTG